MKSQNVSLLSDDGFHFLIYSNLFSLKVKIYIRSAFYNFWPLFKNFFLSYVFLYVFLRNMNKIVEKS